MFNPKKWCKMLQYFSLFLLSALYLFPLSSFASDQSLPEEERISALTPLRFSSEQRKFMDEFCKSLSAPVSLPTEEFYRLYVNPNHLSKKRKQEKLEKYYEVNWEEYWEEYRQSNEALNCSSEESTKKYWSLRENFNGSFAQKGTEKFYQSLGFFNNVSDEEQGHIRGNIEKIEESFFTILNAFQERRALKINKKEYMVLRKEPKLLSTLYDGLPTRLYKGYKVAPVRTNPCYVCGLGPYLLKEKDIENLPHQTQWLLYAVNIAKYKKETYITVRYTSNDNPHWGNIFTHPAPFNNPVNHYWHTEANTISTMPIRTVNFLLKKV